MFRSLDSLWRSLIKSLRVNFIFQVGKIKATYFIADIIAIKAAGISTKASNTKSLYSLPVRSSAASATPKYTTPTENLNVLKHISVSCYISKISMWTSYDKKQERIISGFKLLRFQKCIQSDFIGSLVFHLIFISFIRFLKF